MRYCGRSRRWQRRYRRRHRLRRHSRCATRRAASAARHFGNEPTVPLGPLHPFLRFLGFYEAKVIYGARFTAAFLPPSSLCPSPPGRPIDRVSAGHDQGLYFSSSTFPLAPARRAMHLFYSRDYRPSKGIARNGFGEMLGGSY